jgi:ribosomal protein L37E
MSSTKCKSCGLPNFPHEDACRRCGTLLYHYKKKRSPRPRRFSFGSLLIIVCVGGFAYYSYYGLQKSADDVYAGEVNRVAQQKNDKTAGLSRNEYENQRKQTFSSAIKNSNGLAAHDQHIQETQKAMEAVSNAQQGKE